MDYLIEIINSNIQYAPLMMFGALLLAGFCLPVSEDAMIFIAAILSLAHPHMQYQLFLGVFAGAYVSDLICYAFCGRYLGAKLFNHSFFRRFVNEKQLDKIAIFYANYGIMALILGRFIPFGVRNALFISAGIARMNFIKFALTDFIACAISVSTFYLIYFIYGPSVIALIQKGNIVLFSMVAVAVIFYFWKRKKRIASKTVV